MRGHPPKHRRLIDHVSERFGVLRQASGIDCVSRSGNANLTRNGGNGLWMISGDDLGLDTLRCEVAKRRRGVVTDLVAKGHQSHRLQLPGQGVAAQRVLGPGEQ